MAANRDSGATDSHSSECNFSRQLCVGVGIQRRIAVLSNGNIDVGKKSSARKTGQPIVGRLFVSNGLPQPRIDQSKPAQATRRDNKCGAMAQQRGESGNYSVPQELLHLVGCREKAPPQLPKAPAKR